MKGFLIILFSVFCLSAFSQAPVNRSSPSVTAQDARLKAMLNFVIPTAQDTTLNGGLDSLGSLIFRRLDSSVYVRIQSTPGINKWVKLVSSTNASSEVVAFRGTIAQIRSINTKSYVVSVSTNFGGGTWYADFTDNSTADNTGTVLVDASGTRWKRSFDGKNFQVQWFTETGNLTTTFASILSIAPSQSNIIGEPNKRYTTDGELVVNKPICLIFNNSYIQTTSSVFSTINIQSDSINISGLSIDLNRLSYNGVRTDGYGHIDIKDLTVSRQYKRGNGLSGGVYLLNTHDVFLEKISGWDIINSDTVASSHSPLIKIVTGKNIHVNGTTSDSVGVCINFIDVNGGYINDTYAYHTKDNVFYVQGQQTKGIFIDNFTAIGFEEGMVFNTGTWDFDAAVKVSNGRFYNSTNRDITLRKGRGLSISDITSDSSNAFIAQSNSADGVHDITMTNIQIKRNRTNRPVYFNKDSGIVVNNMMLTQPLADSTSAFSFVNSQGIIATNMYSEDSLGKLRFGVVINGIKDATFDNNLSMNPWGGDYSETNSTRYTIRNRGYIKSDSIDLVSTGTGGFEVQSPSGPAIFNIPNNRQFSLGKGSFNQMEFWSPSMGSANSNLYRLGTSNTANSGRNNGLGIFLRNAASGTNRLRGLYIGIDSVSFGSNGLDYILSEHRSSDTSNSNTSVTQHFRIGWQGIGEIRTSWYIGLSPGIHPSAILQAQSTSKGFLPPVMNNTQMNNISSPATGLLIFNTNDSSIYVYSGASWFRLYTPYNFINLQINNSGTFAVTGLNKEIIHTGGNSTYTMLPIAGNNRNYFFIKNRGTGTITINSDAGGNDFADSLIVSSITIPPGDAVRLFNDGTYWDVYRMRYSGGSSGGGGSGTVNSVSAGNGMSFTTITTTGTVTMGTPSDITSASTNSVSAGTHTHALNNSGVSAGNYTNANITVDAKGRVTAAANGSTSSGTVTSVAQGNGMSFSTITNTGTVTLGTPSDITSISTNSVSAGTHTHALNNSGVSAGSYTNSNITVDAKGRITAASNGVTVNTGATNRVAIYTGTSTIGAHSAITANMALISNASGLPVASTISATILGYLAGLTGNVQDTLNAIKDTLQQNQQIPFTLWRDSEEDSIKLEIGGSDAMGVYSPYALSGNYSPTPASQVNLSSITVNDIIYNRSSSNVNITGRIEFTPTLATTTSFELPLPSGCSSNFTSAIQAWGTFTLIGSSGDTIPVSSSASNDRIIFSWSQANTTPAALSFNVNYRILP